MLDMHVRVKSTTIVTAPRHFDAEAKIQKSITSWPMYEGIAFRVSSKGA